MVIEQLIPRRVPDGAGFVKYLKLALEKLEIIENFESKHNKAMMVADVLENYIHCVVVLLLW